MVYVKIWQFIHVFILGKIVQGNVFQGSLGREKAFLNYKNNKLKKYKNWHFSEGVSPWFSSNIATFLCSYFREKRPGKCVLRYSKEKTRLFRL